MRRLLSENYRQKSSASNEYYGKLIQGLSEKAELKAILESDGNEAFMEAVGKEENAIRATWEKAIERINKVNRNQAEYLADILDFFFIGRNVYFPLFSFEEGLEKAFSVFLGFIIDLKKKIPTRRALSSCDSQLVAARSTS